MCGTTSALATTETLCGVVFGHTKAMDGKRAILKKQVVLFPTISRMPDAALKRVTHAVKATIDRYLTGMASEAIGLKCRLHYKGEQQRCI